MNAAEKGAFDIFGARWANQGENSKENEEFQAASATGFGIKTKMGWRFVRDAGEDPAYAALATRDEKAKFRQDWAAKKYAEKQHEKARKNSGKRHEHVDMTKGTFHGFYWILTQEGGTVG